MDNILDLAINLFDEVETVHQMRESFRFDTRKQNAEDFMREECELYERIRHAVDEFNGEDFSMLAFLFRLYSDKVATHYNRLIDPNTTCPVINFMRMPKDQVDIYYRLFMFCENCREFKKIVRHA